MAKKFKLYKSQIDSLIKDVVRDADAIGQRLDADMIRDANPVDVAHALLESFLEENGYDDIEIIDEKSKLPKMDPLRTVSNTEIDNIFS